MKAFVDKCIIIWTIIIILPFQQRQKSSQKNWKNQQEFARWHNFHLQSIENRWKAHKGKLFRIFGWHVKNHEPLRLTAVDVLLIKDLTHELAPCFSREI